MNFFKICFVGGRDCRGPGWQLENGAPALQGTHRLIANLWEPEFTPKHSDLDYNHPKTMTKKRKEDRRPQKLTVFFPQQQHGGRQDGTGMSSTLVSHSSPWASQQGTAAHNSGSLHSPHLSISTPLSKARKSQVQDGHTE